MVKYACVPGTQLEQRDSEVRQLRGERRTVDDAVEELRTMLMQSVAERTRLAGAPPRMRP